MKLSVIGVYPVEEADGPCHLVEVTCEDVEEDLDVGAFCQADPSLPRSDWQAPYDERFLTDDGTAEVDPGAPELQPEARVFRLVFFFHELDLARPLESAMGPLPLPEPRPIPARLRFVDYMMP